MVAAFAIYADFFRETTKVVEVVDSDQKISYIFAYAIVSLVILSGAQRLIEILFSKVLFSFDELEDLKILYRNGRMFVLTALCMPLVWMIIR